METAVLKLAQLGLSEYEAKAYIALLKESPSSAYEIAKNSGIPTAKVYEVLKRLETRFMIQPIYGKRTRMFIPKSLDEFAENFKAIVEGNLQSVKKELQDIKTGIIDTSYTWHIKDYDALILKAGRMLDTAEKTVLLSVWPQEIETLSKSLIDAESRRVKIVVVHYGPTNTRVGQLYRHPVEETIYSQKGIRGFILAADSKEALTGKLSGKETEAIWSMNEGFVIMAEDYIRHDIYLMKIISRFAPVLKEKFGASYEKLLDIYRDEG